MTSAERMARLRARQALRHEPMPRDATKSSKNTSVPGPQDLARTLFNTAGGPYCREVAKFLLLYAIWDDDGRPADFEQRHPDVRRMVDAWVQLRI